MGDSLGSLDIVAMQHALSAGEYKPAARVRAGYRMIRCEAAGGTGSMCDWEMVAGLVSNEEILAFNLNT
jgi:hypothetical protein